MAQQPIDCNNCACNIPSTGMLGQTLYGSGNQPVCDPNAPAIYTMDINRFGRFWGVPGRRYTISLCNNTLNTVLYITTNTTIPGVLACDDNGCGTPNGPSSQSFVPTMATTYRFYAFNAACGSIYPVGTMAEVMITCTTINPPSNDNPCGATPIPLNGTACNFAAGDNMAATNSGAPAPVGIGNIPIPQCTGAGYQGADLWYSVQVPASGLIGIQTQESIICAGAFELYTSGSCSNGPGFVPLPGSCTIVGQTGPNSQPAGVFDVSSLPVGSTVYIRYWERNGNENGAFEICAWEAQRPPNDEPCDAIAMPLNTTCVPTQYTFENGSASTVPNPTCGNVGNVNDVWFTFTVPNPLPGNWTGITTSASPNAPLDLAMAWYRPTPPTPCDPANFAQIACSPTGTINSAAPNVPLNPGETIYVRIWGESQWIGTYDLCAVLNQAPANDQPCGAFALPVNYGCIMSTYSNASATVTTVPGTPTCGPTVNGDVWFTAVMPATGPLQIDMLAGQATDMAMAAYTGNCNSLTQIAGAGGCAANGSQQGPGNGGMPYLNITGPAPGSTVWIRVWSQNGNLGTFGICARRTDPPPGNCSYTLTMTDSGGDGWGGSYVTICINGNCNPYTVAGSSASITVGVNVGQTFTVSYTAVGGQQAQNSYIVTQYGQPVYVSGTTPDPGIAYSTTVACDPPPAPAGDCMGAVQICSSTNIPCSPYQPGAVTDLNGSNSGCMSGQQQGVFMILNFGPNTLPCTPVAFDVVPGNSVPCGSWSNNIFDFVIWGPYTNAGPGGMVNAGNVCPINQLPYRCNWASLSSPTVKGLAFNNSLPVSQNGGGGPMARHMVVNPGDRFLLFVNNWSGTGQQFSIQWKTPPPTFQVLPSDCNQTSPWVDGPAVPAPPGSYATPDCTPLAVELLSFTAQPADKHVDVRWSTASEQGSAYFNVERSADGQVFESIGRVDAAVNSSAMIDYHFVDDAPLNGLSYYRLMQVDMHDEATHSQVVPVIFRGNSVNMDVFPNPADDILWLSFPIEEETQLHARIHDASGRLVGERIISSNTGRNLTEIPIEKFDQGSYTIELVTQDGERIGISRFVKR